MVSSYFADECTEDKRMHVHGSQVGHLLDKKIRLFSFGSFTEHQSTKVKRGKERELTVMKCPPGASHILMHLIFPVRYKGELLLALLYRRGS